MLYFVPRIICKLMAYRLAISAEKKEGRREKSSGSTIGIEADVSHSMRFKRPVVLTGFNISPYPN